MKATALCKNCGQMPGDHDEFGYCTYFSGIRIIKYEAGPVAYDFEQEVKQIRDLVLKALPEKKTDL